MKIKIIAEDRRFSHFIRTRDKKCVRCESPVRFKKGKPVSHSTSHYITRGNWAVRFDEDNGDTLCFPCHQLWGGDLREEYKKYKIKQLGKAGFKKLIKRSNQKISKLKARVIAKEKY